MNKLVKINQLAAHLWAEATSPGQHSEWRREDKRRSIRVALELQTESGDLVFTRSRNVTPISLCLTSKMSVNENESVQVRRAHTDEAWSNAVVAHCTTTVSGYLIGLQMC